ncbi:secretin N-terminal domain-containing protein [Geothrix mesophila]|uniref:secretin N-terminal domain-containing protein n=1 Tax=Geothrix mesophila TaxID=2922723 RepID=UPI001FAC8A11|nr:secretin N-terminal domain-containing protein [Geothrix sp. SG198]
MSVRLALAFATLIGTALPALAQTTAPPAAAQPKAPEPDPDPAMLRAMKSKVFEVKHRSPLWLANSLRALGSGVRGSRLDWTNDDGLRLLTVRDFPENLAAIEEAIKRLDAPTAIKKTPNVELTLQILFASKAQAQGSGLPSNLDGVVKQLKDTLDYRSYTLGATVVQRVHPREQLMEGIRMQSAVDPSGMGASAGKDTPELSIDCSLPRGIVLENTGSETFVFRIESFRLNLMENRSDGRPAVAGMSTELSLKEGETVVVGTSVVKGRGLIVVLSARRVN